MRASLSRVLGILGNYVHTIGILKHESLTEYYELQHGVWTFACTACIRPGDNALSLCKYFQTVLVFICVLLASLNILVLFTILVCSRTVFVRTGVIKSFEIRQGPDDRVHILVSPDHVISIERVIIEHNWLHYFQYNKITANDLRSNGSKLWSTSYFPPRVKISKVLTRLWRLFVHHAKLRHHAILKRTSNVCFKDLEEVTSNGKVTRNTHRKHGQ